MSTSLPPLSSITRRPGGLARSPDNTLPPLEIWESHRRRPMAPSSSPAQSSSPPRTPYSSRDSDSYAYFQSSPTISYGLDSPTFRPHAEDPSAWSSKYPRISLPFKANPNQPNHYDPYDHPPPSEMDLEIIVDDVEISFPEIDSETTSDSTPGHGSIYFSDSEEELGLDDTEGGGLLTFGYSSLRSTSFRVSSERGQWKDDPLALTASATSNLTKRLRQSVPTPSRQASESPPVSLRPLSVPLPTSTSEKQLLDGVPPRDRSDAPALAWESAIPAQDAPLAPSQDPSTPSTSDGPITHDPNAAPLYSSPLPPSSPILSPMSGCVSSMSRSVSPLSLPPSSPVIAPSSPLSSLDGYVPMNEEPIEDEIPSPSESRDHLPAMRVDHENLEASVSIARSLQTTSSVPSAGNSPADSQSTFDIQTSIPLAVDVSTSRTASTTLTASSAAGGYNQNDAIRKVVEKQKTRAKDDSKSFKAQDESSDLGPQPKPKKKRAISKPSKVSSSETSTKRKAENLDDVDAPPKKRRQSSTGGDNVASSSALKPKTPDDDDDDEDSLPQPKAPKGHKKRAGTREPSGHSKKERVAQLFALESPQKEEPGELVPEVIDAEIKGILLVCMATSRASSMPVSLLSRMMLENNPNLKAQRTEKEWRKVICRVLVNGTAGRGSGVFGKVDSSGKDDSDRPLEAQWFYVPEMDEDQERAALIRNMMPRPGKRSVTKQYKQYYWRPLEKISRWDPEDEL